MKYRIVQTIEGKLIKTEPTDVYAWAAVAGVEVTGYNHNPRQRAELQDQPRLKGFAGPMWDGDAVRYEDARAYAMLST